MIKLIKQDSTLPEPVKQYETLPKPVKPKQKQLGKDKAQVRLRAKKVAAGLLAGMTKKAAMVAAGYSKATANNPSQTIYNPVFKNTYTEILEKAGVTDEACAKVLREAMDADHLEGEEKVADHAIRLRATDQRHRLLALYVERKEHSGPGGGPIRITDMTDEELEIIARAGSHRVVKAPKGQKQLD